MKSAELAVISEEKRDATGVPQWPFLVLTVKFIHRERSSPDRFAKIFFGSGFSAGVHATCHVYSRTRKSQETEIIRIFLLWEFAWRNQVMNRHGECQQQREIENRSGSAHNSITNGARMMAKE